MAYSSMAYRIVGWRLLGNTEIDNAAINPVKRGRFSFQDVIQQEMHRKRVKARNRLSHLSRILMYRPIARLSPLFPYYALAVSISRRSAIFVERSSLPSV